MFLDISKTVKSLMTWKQRTNFRWETSGYQKEYKKRPRKYIGEKRIHWGESNEILKIQSMRLSSMGITVIKVFALKMMF